MTGKELFAQLEIELSRIGITNHSLVVYREIKESLSNFEIVDFFAQIKKNDKGEGLALEIVIFDEKIIHDIVIARTTADYISIPLNKIKLIFLESNFKEELVDSNSTNADKIKLTISYGGEMKLFYIATSKRLSEFIRIKNNLIKMLAQ